MGYGSEIQIEMEIVSDIAYQKELQNIKNGIWIKKNKEVIDIKNMTNSYIKNCINYLSKNTDEISELWIDRFKKELEFRDYIKRIMSEELNTF